MYTEDDIKGVVASKQVADTEIRVIMITDLYFWQYYDTLAQEWLPRVSEMDFEEGFASIDDAVEDAVCFYNDDMTWC